VKGRFGGFFMCMAWCIQNLIGVVPWINGRKKNENSQAAKLSHERKYFGTDGIRGQANIHPMTPEVAMKVGMAVGVCFQSRRPPPPRGDRQGYAAVRLHARKRAGRRLYRGGVDVFLLGPMPTPAVAMLTRRCAPISA
jgi:hypothetical protein